jgi:hypothetical protein
MIRATSIEFPAVRRSGSRAIDAKRFQYFGTELEKQLLVIGRLTIDERSSGVINGNGSVDDLVFHRRFAHAPATAPYPFVAGAGPFI